MKDPTVADIMQADAPRAHQLLVRLNILKVSGFAVVHVPKQVQATVRQSPIERSVVLAALFRVLRGLRDSADLDKVETITFAVLDDLSFLHVMAQAILLAAARDAKDSESAFIWFKRPIHTAVFTTIGDLKNMEQSGVITVFLSVLSQCLS